MRKVYRDKDFNRLIDEYFDEATSLDRKEDIEWELRECYTQVIEQHPDWAGKKPTEIYNLISENL